MLRGMSRLVTSRSATGAAVCGRSVRGIATARSGVLLQARSVPGRPSPFSGTIGASSRLQAAVASSGQPCGSGSSSSFGSGLRMLSSSAGDKEDYYAALGIDKDASASDVKKAYYKKAKQYHPDTNAGDPEAAKKFAALTEAYDVLSDSSKRKMYDAYGHAGVDESGGGMGGGFHGGFGRGGPMNAEDIFSIFEEAFGAGAFGNRRPRGPPRGRDVQISLTLDLLEAVKGTKKTVAWRSAASGKQTLEVTVPAGVDSGMNLRLNGKGEEGPGGSGNLYITLMVQDHPVFERDGADVHVKVRLTLCEAILGATVSVPTLDGPVNLKVPPGTQTGDRRVMTGRGVKGAANMIRGAAGHQYVHFQVIIPRRLSDEQRKLLEAFEATEEGLGEEERTKREAPAS